MHPSHIVTLLMKSTLTFSTARLSYTYGTETIAVPLGFGALVWCREFPLPEKHFNRVLLSGHSRLGMTMPCLHKQGKMQRASSYQNRQNGHWQNSRNQEIASHMVSSYMHLCIKPPFPMPLGSGKPPLPLAHIEFSCHCGKDTNVLPLPF